MEPKKSPTKIAVTYHVFGVQVDHQKYMLGGGFTYMFSPVLGEDSHFD